MNITILAIGKKTNHNLSDAVSEYCKRLEHHQPLKWRFLASNSKPNDTADKIRQIESKQILNTLQSEDIVILLDEKGDQLSSPELADILQQYRNSSVKNLILVIGGAYGVDQAVLQRADRVWCLSKLVFPHQLVRLIVVEQLYRAHSITQGKKYHHD